MSYESLSPECCIASGFHARPDVFVSMTSEGISTLLGSKVPNPPALDFVVRKVAQVLINTSDAADLQFKHALENEIQICSALKHPRSLA